MLVKIKQYAISAIPNGLSGDDERKFLSTYDDNGGWNWSVHLSEAKCKDSLAEAKRYCDAMEGILSDYHDFQIHEVDVTMTSDLKDVRGSHDR